MYKGYHYQIGLPNSRPILPEVLFTLDWLTDTLSDIEVTATEVCKVQLGLWFYIETISIFQCFAITNTDAIRIGFLYPPDIASPISFRAVKSLDTRPT